VPEGDSRVEPDRREYDHFPRDPKTGEHIMTPEYRKRHPERVIHHDERIDINRPCPPGVRPPADVIEAHRDLERRRPELERRRRLFLQQRQQRDKKDTTN
jgi:hypothetical protein